MNHKLKVSQSVQINSTPEKVWDALVNPEKIKVYLFGTRTTSDWKVGSPIAFQGEMNGQQYNDKGNVLENKENKLLKYNYWSSFSGVADEIENYCLVTYHVEDEGNGEVKFTWDQEGFSSEQAQQHTKQGLVPMLEQIKSLVEAL